MREAPDFQPYFRAIFDRLGLKDWEVVIEDDPPENPDAFANVECVYGRKLAHVSLSRNYLRSSEEKQRHGATHEALHCHHTMADQIVGKLANDGEYAYYRLAHEYGIDGVAVAVAPLMPLPSEVVGDAR